MKWEDISVSNFSKAIRKRSNDVNTTVKLETLIERAGLNGLEVGLGFSTEGFYAFLTDCDGAVTVTESYRELNQALTNLSVRLNELLGQFPERRV